MSAPGKDMMHHINANIDAHAQRAQQEISDLAQKARDEISVKVGWMIRSDAQLRRFRNARNAKQ